MRTTLPLALAVYLVSFVDSGRGLELLRFNEVSENEGSFSRPLDYALPIEARDSLKGKVKKLDVLFRQLLAARDETVARDLEKEIWSLWLVTGDEENDQLMKQAINDMNAGSFDSSLQKLNKLVSRMPNHSEAWNKRATVLYLLHRYDESLADISKVLSLEPRHFGAISGIALISLAKGDKKAALEAYRRAVMIYPLMPGAAAIISVLEKEVEGIEL